MAMTADEVYVALEMLMQATAYEFDENDKRWRKHFDDLENRMQRRIDGIWKKLDEIGGPDR
jgi:DNA-binding transcriptional MocR family regulator